MFSESEISITFFNYISKTIIGKFEYELSEHKQYLMFEFIEESMEIEVVTNLLRYMF
jgi:hypothetical protein